MYKNTMRWSQAFQSYVTLTMLENHEHEEVQNTHNSPPAFLSRHLSWFSTTQLGMNDGIKSSDIKIQQLSRVYIITCNLIHIAPWKIASSKRFAIRTFLFLCESCILFVIVYYFF